MMKMDSTRNYTILAAISTASGLIGLFLPFNTPFTWLAGLIYCLGGAWLAGGFFFKNEHPVWRLTLGLLTFIATWSAVGGIFYQLYRLNLPILILLVISLPLAFVWLSIKYGPEDPSKLMAPIKRRPRIRLIRTATGLLLGLSALTLAGTGFSLLHQAATDISVRSPWDSVPQAFFVIFFLTALAAFGLTLSGAIRSWSAIPLVALSLLAVSVAVLTYKVGFGFDPFIHQATEKIIYATGSISPKPFYYSGQYALVVAIAKLTKISLVTIDRWLVPLSFALLVPFAGWCMKRAFAWKSAIALTAASGLLLLPLSPFIATTPQGWANILALAAFFAALPATTKDRPLGPLGRQLPVLFALAAAITHPLTGLPLLVFIAAWLVLTSPEKRGLNRAGQWITVVVIALLGSIVLPAAFMANSAVSGTDVNWDGRLLSSPTEVITELRAVTEEAGRRFLPTLDIAYLWKQARSSAVWLLGLVGLLVLFRKRRIAAAYAVGLIALAGNWLILKTSVNFNFLIDYERTDYVNRLSDLILYILAPMAVYALGLILIRIRRSFPVMRLAAVVLLATFVTSSLYLAYPRRDKYESSRGWSTSESDIKAVQLIEADAQNRPYVVLANQSVSAAAIQELGFSRYYESQDRAHSGEIYFYPIPTGEPLYSLYLEMNETMGDPEIAARAMSLTGADTVYYVVNHYWWHARQIISKANLQADKKWKIDNKDFVFRYDKK